MNREIFLQTLWKPYPALFGLKTGWIHGRIHSIKDKSIILIRNNKETKIEISSQTFVEHVSLGASVRLEDLKKGDVVSFDLEKKVFYLLSPNLSNENRNEKSFVEGWNVFLNQVRSFFTDKDFLEVHTPYLVKSPGVDHHIEFFKVQGSQSGRQWHLPTSPEIALKKELCNGQDQIFEVKSCFRDDLNSPYHRAEFKMLEWYRAYSDLDDIAEDLKDLIFYLKKKIKGGAQSEAINFEKISLPDLFQSLLSKNFTPNTTLSDLKQWASDLDISTADDDDWNDVFFRIYIEKIEKHLGEAGPTLIYDFPPQQSSLARINSRGWADRFELYWHGIELANAYFELNSPDENKDKFIEEAQLRKNSGRRASPIDETFIEDLKKGMPPAAGIALGLDRLFMVLGQKKQIHSFYGRD